MVSSGRRPETKAGTHSVCDSQAPFGAYGSTDAVTNINVSSHDSCHLLSAYCVPGHLSLMTVLHRRYYYSLTVHSQVSKPSF